MWVIDGFSRLLAEDGDDDTHAEHIERILQGTQRMLDFMRAIETLSAASSKEIENEPVNLAELAREALDTCRAHESERDVASHVPDLPSVRGDRELLTTVITELVRNAWASTRTTPGACITLGRQQGNAGDDHPDMTVYSLTDNGVGFPAAQLEGAFAPFRCLHASTDPRPLGVGLALVRRIIHRHGGRVWAVNEPAGGASVCFTLPTATASRRYDRIPTREAVPARRAW